MRERKRKKEREQKKIVTIEDICVALMLLFIHIISLPFYANIIISQGQMPDFNEVYSTFKQGKRIR